MGPFVTRNYLSWPNIFFICLATRHALSAEVKDDRAPVFCPISKAKFAATLVVWRSAPS